MQPEPRETSSEAKNDDAVPSAEDTGAENRAAGEHGPDAAQSGGGEGTDATSGEQVVEHHPDEEEIRENIIGVMRTIYDPEIPVNIYDIGLIYGIDVDTESKAFVRMTLTSPACPVAGTLPGEVEQKIAGAQGVSEASVELVWDPPWGIERMSEAARLQLNL